MHAQLRKLQVRPRVRSIYFQRQSERVPERQVQLGQEEAAVAAAVAAEPQTPVLAQIRAPVRQVDASPPEAEVAGVEAARDSHSTLIKRLILAEGCTYRELLLGLRVPSSTGGAYYSRSTNHGASRGCGRAPPTRGRHGRDCPRDSRGHSGAAGHLFLLGTLLCQRLTLAPRQLAARTRGARRRSRLCGQCGLCARFERVIELPGSRERYGRVRGALCGGQ